VCYRTNATAPWVAIAGYSNSTVPWTERIVSLPNPGSNYYIAFEGDGRFGHGVCIDDVLVLTTPPAAPPTITVQPTNLTVTVGQAAQFRVTATGDAPLMYQWRKGGNPVGSATNTAYGTGSVGNADHGAYDVVVSNAVGSVTSQVARLTVLVLEGFVDTNENAVADDWEAVWYPAGNAPAVVTNNGVELTLREVFLAGLEPGGTNLFRVTAIGLGAGMGPVGILFTSASNRFYDLQYKSNLHDMAWSVLTNNLPGKAGSFQVLDPVVDPQRFYRVRVKLKAE
jgi:hypothetical protein